MTTTTTAAQTETADVQVREPKSSTGKAKAPAAPKSPSQVLAALYRGDGALTSEEVSAALTIGLSARSVADAFPQASTDAEAKVSDAMAALTAAREHSRRIAREGGEANVTLARVLFLVAAKDVRGSVAMTGKEIAAAWGVTPGYVSQYVTKGRALHALGTWTPDAYATVDKTYRKAKSAGLSALVNAAQGIASASVPAQHEGEVRVTSTHVREAAETIIADAQAEAPAAPVAPKGDVRVTAITRQVRNTLDTVTAAYKTDRLRCTAEDLTHARAALAALAAFLDTVQPDAQA